jgi:signal transduction histidine kinase
MTALRRRNSELEARNSALAAFDHTVAHELKGPLALIIGLAELLEEQVLAMPEEDLRGHLRAIARHGRTLSGIIDALLLLASVREMELAIQPLDMASIVTEALKRLTYLVEPYQTEIIVPDHWPAALGYGPWVEQVWANLVSNAIKYGGTPPRVALGATKQADGTVRFWVRDNGNGLSSKERHRLFSPFTRLDRTRARGHGLGLSIVRQIVSRLGGEVGVESKGLPGEGSVFSFTLPGVEE